MSDVNKDVMNWISKQGNIIDQKLIQGKPAESMGNLNSSFHLKIFGRTKCRNEEINRIYFDSKSPDKLHDLCNMQFESMRLVNGPEIDFYADCNKDSDYAASMFELDGCLNRYEYPTIQSLIFKTKLSLDRKQISDETMKTQWNMQDHHPSLPSNGVPKARIVFSCESSEYFGYQVATNYYAYLTSVSHF
jgi:hypothetical protein